MNDIKLCSIWLYAQGVLNPIMATHDPGLTTAVAIPSAVLPSVAGKQWWLRNVHHAQTDCGFRMQWHMQ